MSEIWMCVAAMALASLPAAHAQRHEINLSRSCITIHVGKAGLFSAFGHEHEIRAPVAAGEIDASQNPRVEIEVKSAELKVVDRDVSTADRESIQETMLSPVVLDSKKYPEIRFRSTAIKKLESKRWRVTGDLTLHGQTH